MKKVILALVCVFIVTSAGAHARIISDDMQKDCKMEGKATVSVNLNYTETDVGSVSQKIDQNAAKIEALAKDVQVEKIHLKSMNYNISSDRNRYDNMDGKREYRVSGSLSFQIEPADKAASLMALLEDQGFNARVNANAYRRCH